MDIHSQQIAPSQIEIKQSNEQAEKQVASILIPRLRMKGNSEEFLKTKLIIKQVDKGVFSVGTTESVSFFCDEKGEAILKLISQREAYYFKQAGYLAWFREVKESDGKTLNLYHIRDIDNKGNPLSWVKPIDKFSREYYQAFMDIDFYDDRLVLETFKKPDAVEKSTSESEKKFTKPDTQLLLSLATSVMRIKDLVILKKQWQVTESDYKSALAILQKNLLNTIGDYRFERVNQGVTRGELDLYLNDGLIDKALHSRAIQRLEQVEKIKKAVGDKHSEIMSETQIKTAELMNMNNENVA